MDYYTRSMKHVDEHLTYGRHTEGGVRCEDSS